MSVSAAVWRSALSVPYDPELRAMLDAGALEPDDLRRDTRMAIKRLGLAVAEGLA